jgi:hypothetical protein
VTSKFEQPHPLAVLLLFAALSVFWTWPLATQLSSRIAFDPGDPFLNTWIIWWNSQAVPFTEKWWSPPIFYPMRGALALSEHLAGIGIFTAPLIHLGGTPALAYNASLLLSYALSGFFCYLLVRHLTGSTIAALCAGLAYGFAPFRAGQLSHLQVLTSQWLPLQLLGLHAYLDTNRPRWLAVFGVAWVLQGLSNGYYLLFAPALLGLWGCWFLLAAGRWRQLLAVSAAGAVSSLVLLPAILGYRQVHGALGLARGRTEIIQFNGSFESFLKPSYMLAFWPPREAPTVEDYLFPGLTIVLLIVAAAVAIPRITPVEKRRLAGTYAFYVVAALFMAALTFGPAAPDAGPAGWLKPYQWFVDLPGFNGLRVPVRFGMLMALCLAVAGGVGLSMILPARGALRIAVGIVVALGLSIDGMMKPLPVSPPPGRVELPDVPYSAVLELPADDAAVSVAAMFRSMSHRRPLINGYSGHIPPHYDILSKSLRRDDHSAVLELARGRTLLILISERRDPAGDFRRVIESIPGVQRGEASAAGTSYILRAQPRERRPTGGAVHPFTATRFPRNHVVLDLGTTRVIRALEFPLRDHYDDFGARFAIEASNDGQAWTTVLVDWTGGPAIAGALEDQVRVPVQFVVPDIAARFLRIHPAEPWLIDELVVRGP